MKKYSSIFRWTPLFLMGSLFLLTLASVSAMTIEIGSVASPSALSRQSWLEKMLVSRPFQTLDTSLLTVHIDPSQVEPRGRFQKDGITLSSHITGDPEFYALFLHELAHYVDIVLFREISGMPDPSSSFYLISWKTPDTKRIRSKMSNFVTGYAATSQYEDFAETFVFYILHNQTFLDRAHHDTRLQQKYDFFRSRVFSAGTFVGTEFSTQSLPVYTWDSTKIPFSLKKYLYFLQ